MAGATDSGAPMGSPESKRYEVDSSRDCKMLATLYLQVKTTSL